MGGGWQGWRTCTRGVVVERRRFRLRGLAGPLRLVVLADLHVRCCQGILPHASLGWVRSVLALAAEHDADILCLLGDLTRERMVEGDKLSDLVAALDAIPARYGRFACLGNHDVWLEDRAGIHDPYAGSGIRLLDDEWTTVATNSGPIALGGIRWTWEGWCQSPVPGSAPHTRPRILLAHDPAPAEWVRDPDAMDLILSGHTHGGQIRIPFVEEPWTRGSKYVSGTYTLGPSSYLHVNRGIGTVILPLRFGSRPEVTVIDLAPAEAEPES